MAIGSQFPTLLDAARAGGEWAWKALYEDLAPVVLGYLRARGASSPEDVCGDVFCQIVRDIHGFEGDERGFRSWVFVIAHHRLLDDSRRRRRRPELSVEPQDLVGQLDHADTEAEALGRVELARIRALIEELSPAQRDVVLLRVLAGLSIEEVARVTGRSAGAVKSLQHRALDVLRSKLETGTFPNPPALTQSP